MPRSGSKRGSGRPGELAAWQLRALDVISGASLARELTFGGGAALAAIHLHHRTSDDLDFFAERPIDPRELEPIRHQLATKTTRVDTELVGPRTSLLLRRRTAVVGRIDFAYYPYEPVGRRTAWRGLSVEALLDMTINKVQAVLTRFQPRDFVDLFFLLREGPERDIMKLLGYARAKFDMGVHDMGFAARLLLVRDIRELPRMVRPLDILELVAFFEAKARELASRK